MQPGRDLHAWKGRPWGREEVLTGKSMPPTPGMEKTILIGRCMVKAHRAHPGVREPIAVKGCPPKSKDLLKALHRAGIEADAGFSEQLDRLPGLFMGRYTGRPEFEERHFRVGHNRGLQTRISLNFLRNGSIRDRCSGGSISTFIGRLEIRPAPAQARVPPA